MSSGTAEPECRAHPSAVLPAGDTTMSGADMARAALAATQTSQHAAPLSEATKIAARATIHPLVNGVATAECMPCSTAVI